MTAAGHGHRPSLTAIVRHLTISLLIATLIPSAMFTVCMEAWGVTCALVATLVWCYAVMAWRVHRRQRISGLLVLTLASLTAKSLFALVSGSTYFYFIQPAITDIVIAAIFAASMASARPMALRLAADFYPMDDDVLGRPRVQRLCRWLTVFWANVFLAKGVLTIWLLESLSTGTFVAVKGAAIAAIVLASTVFTLVAAVRVGRSEGLLHTSPVAA